MFSIPDASGVLDVLRPVQDAELRQSWVELNMIRNLQGSCWKDQLYSGAHHTRLSIRLTAIAQQIAMRVSVAALAS